MRSAESKYIVMLGNDLRALGGMSAVVNSYFAGGLGGQWPIRYLASFHHKKTLNKLWMAAKAFVQLLLWLSSGRVAAVHAHSAARGSFWRKRLYLGLARRFGCKTFLHIHDGSFVQWYEESLSAASQAAVRETLKSVDRVVVLSEVWAEQLRAIQPLAKYSAIDNPVAIPDVSQLHIHRASPPTRILFMARLWPQKGIYELLEAFASMNAALPDTLLVCAGDGDLQAVQARVKHLGIEERVEFLGWIDGAAKIRELASADLFVLPSYHEGVPVGILEAMAWAVPVVASDVGGIAESMGDAGLLCKAQDVESLREALERVLRSPELALDLGRKGRQRAERRFAIPVVLAALGVMYREAGLAPLEMPRQPREELTSAE